MKIEIVYQFIIRNKSSKPRENTIKKDLLKNLLALFVGKERVRNAFGSEKLPIKI